DKALNEIKRVLRPGGIFYVTANSKYSMEELNKLVENFDSKSGLNSNGYSTRFELENGKEVLERYFKNIDINILNGKIIIDNPEPVVSYKASTIQGSKILIGDKRKEFKEYLKKYIKINKTISITTKTCMFKCEK
ncbi:MAG: methyltransferase type 11, partial [Clostridium butyricum]|nr:methyltransferase type 11 [Clostridium butyricum]